MAIMLKTTARFLLLGFLSFGTTLGNSVSLSMSTQTGNVGEPLELTCLLNPTSGAIITSVQWFLSSDTTGIQLSAAACTLAGPAPSYDLGRYSFTCSSSSNTFKLKILALQNSDNDKCWSCSVKFSNFPETEKASPPACIKLKDYMLLLLLLIIVLPLVFMIMFCCGCLDCCKCCRIFYHYDENKCCYVTWYCLKRGCCSCFCCRAESKRGTLSCCCKRGKECCRGIYFCQKICGCGWFDCCESEKMRSCGGCYCICCVKGSQDEGLDETSSTMNKPPAIHIGTQNKVKAEPSSKQISSSLHRPLSPLGEDKSKTRPQHSSLGNSDASDQKMYGQCAIYDDTTDAARPSRLPRLPPLLATK